MSGIFKSIRNNLLGGPATRAYPHVARAPFPGTRGALAVDIERCILCTLCEKKCPAGAIVVSRPERRLTLDPYKCVVCGVCAELCPADCLSMIAEYRKP